MTETTTPPTYGYAADKPALIKRLHRIEGQVRGIERMLTEDRYCIDVITQIAAVQTALEAVAFKILDKHVNHCVAGAVASGDENLAAELGVDPDDEFARPVTDEVLQAADVIVTMGHSVGVIDIPHETRHEDWRIGDPIGAPVAEIRRVRDDIEYRVRQLLTDLGVPAEGRYTAGSTSSDLRVSTR